mmetsp:Transcript_3559/g.5449  ORF Transcript_3559/g.5449 Transcript_3559/m.5449 type:complete len:105 (+) Transcript_3559:321-635(+)
MKSEKDTLFSYFFGLNGQLARAMDRLAAFDAAARYRCECGAQYSSFQVGMDVWVLVVNNQMRLVRQGWVTSVEGTLGIAFYQGKDARKELIFALDDPNIVIAPG